MLDDNLIEKAKAVKLLISDVDGVMTDGYLIYTEQGHTVKHFHVHDGFGLKLLQSGGIHVGVITMCQSPMVKKRLSDLAIEHAYFGQRTKLAAYDALLEKLQLTADQVAYIGDDLPDLPLVIKSGFGCAVANAVDTVKQAADFVTTKNGGHGAVRELCDLLLHVQGRSSLALERLLKP